MIPQSKRNTDLAFQRTPEDLGPGKYASNEAPSVNELYFFDI